jgi:hypothetical protein
MPIWKPHMQMDMMQCCCSQPCLNTCVASTCRAAFLQRQVLQQFPSDVYPPPQPQRRSSPFSLWKTQQTLFGSQEPSAGVRTRRQSPDQSSPVQSHEPCQVRESSIRMFRFRQSYVSDRAWRLLLCVGKWMQKIWFFWLSTSRQLTMPLTVNTETDQLCRTAEALNVHPKNPTKSVFIFEQVRV